MSVVLKSRWPILSMLLQATTEDGETLSDQEVPTSGCARPCAQATGTEEVERVIYERMRSRP